jgi:hypothetical protein
LELVPAIKIKSTIHILNSEITLVSSEAKAIETKKIVWSYERCYQTYDLFEHSVFYWDQWLGKWICIVSNEKNETKVVGFKYIIFNGGRTNLANFFHWDTDLRIFEN